MFRSGDNKKYENKINYTSMMLDVQKNMLVIWLYTCKINCHCMFCDLDVTSKIYYYEWKNVLRVALPDLSKIKSILNS